MDHEYPLPGWKVALNVTEFLILAISLDELEKYLDVNGRKGCALSGMLMVDPSEGLHLDNNISLPLQ